MLSYRYQLSVFNGVFLSLKNSLPSRDIILPLIHIERLIFLLFLNQNFPKLSSESQKLPGEILIETLVVKGVHLKANRFTETGT